MGTPTQEAGLRAVAEGLAEVLPKIYGQKMGFYLVVAPFDVTPSVSDYIGNADRETVIKWMRELTKRLETNEVIPVTEGNA